MILIGIGGFGAAAYLSGYPRSLLVLLPALLALFLGVTDFGRQCPLILSFRHLLYRVKTRRQPPLF
jgi:hypothetical protein